MVGHVYTDFPFRIQYIMSGKTLQENCIEYHENGTWFRFEGELRQDGEYCTTPNAAEKYPLQRFMCLDNYMLPFVIRNFLGEEITDSDKVFYHEGLLAKFIEVPKIKVDFNMAKTSAKR